MEIILPIILIGLAAGIVKGTSGFGSSLVAVPLLSYIFLSTEPRTMMITTNVVLNTILLVENRKYFKLENIKKIIPLTSAGILFTAVGIYISESITVSSLRMIIGILIFVAIIVKLFPLNVKMKDSLWNRILFGSFSGIGNGIASVDGPPVLLYLTSIDAKKQQFKGTLAFHFLIMGMMAIIILILNQSYTIEILQYTGLLTLFLVVGTLIGIVISKHLNEEKFSKLVLLVLLGLGISMFF